MKSFVNMGHAINRSSARAAWPDSGTVPGQLLGSLIGGIFGLIYVEANTGLLPRPLAVGLQIAAGLAFAGLAALLVRSRNLRAAVNPGGGSGFRGSYWLVVAGEATAIVVGAAVLNGPADLPHAVVAWVSIVVGAHFLVLAALWRLTLFRLLGAAIALCGAAGLGAAASGAPAALIASMGGVLPGILLLAAGYWGVRAPKQAQPAQPEGHAAAAGTGSSQNR